MTTSEMILAGCAVATLLIYFTGAMIGGVVFLWKKIDGVLQHIDVVKKELLDDVKEKHHENQLRVDAIQTLVIRHDTLLDPEYNGTGSRRRSG